MSGSRKSLVALERDARAEREKLTASVIELRRRLKPAALAEDLSEHLKAASSDALHGAVLKAKTPAAIAAAVTALALGGLAYRLRARHAPDPDIRTLEAAARARLPAPYVQPAPPAEASPRDLVKTGLGIAGAVAVGGLVGKLMPISANEKNIWRGVGQELSDAFEEWTHRQAAELVRPKPGQSLSAVNLCALGLGLLLATKSRGAV
jgi:hypothetical protein